MYGLIVGFETKNLEPRQSHMLLNETEYWLLKMTGVSDKESPNFQGIDHVNKLYKLYAVDYSV